MLYITVLYLTQEQELAVKDLFISRQWAYLKPDLSHTTDELGSPAVIQADLIQGDPVCRLSGRRQFTEALAKPSLNTYNDLHTQETTDGLQHVENDSMSEQDEDVMYDFETALEDLVNEQPGCSSIKKDTVQHIKTEDLGHSNTQSPGAYSPYDEGAAMDVFKTPDGSTPIIGKEHVSEVRQSDSSDVPVVISNDRPAYTEGMVPALDVHDYFGRPDCPVPIALKRINSTEVLTSCYGPDMPYGHGCKEQVPSLDKSIETSHVSDEDEIKNAAVQCSDDLKISGKHEKLVTFSNTTGSLVNIVKMFCNECNRTFSTRSVLNRHLRQKHGVKDIVRRKSGPKHQREKSAKTVTCEYCGISYKRTCDLNDHILVKHKSSPLPHQCQSCDQSFIRRALLTAHINRAHLKSKPYTCNLCKKEFHSVQTRNLHMSRGVCQVDDESKWQYECSVCAQRFYTTQHREMHMAAKHFKDSFKCVCGAIIVWKSSVRKHKKTCKQYQSQHGDASEAAMSLDPSLESAEHKHCQVVPAKTVDSVEETKEDKVDVTLEESINVTIGDSVYATIEDRVNVIIEDSHSDDGDSSRTKVLTEGELLEELKQGSYRPWHVPEKPTNFKDV